MLSVLLYPVQSVDDCFCHVDTDYSDVPVGQIFMWYQEPENLSFGWYVCNETNNDWNNTIPNFESQFIVGYDNNLIADINYTDIANTGGLKQVILTIPQLPAHTHTWNHWFTGSLALRAWRAGTGSIGPARLSNPTGGGNAHNNLPPYRVVYYVIYLGV
jgi:microcystin-dependent protein